MNNDCWILVFEQCLRNGDIASVLNARTVCKDFQFIVDNELNQPLSEFTSKCGIKEITPRSRKFKRYIDATLNCAKSHCFKCGSKRNTCIWPLDKNRYCLKCRLEFLPGLDQKVKIDHDKDEMCLQTAIGLGIPKSILDTIDYRLTRNPHYRCEMRLYSVDILEKVLYIVNPNQNGTKKTKENPPPKPKVYIPKSWYYDSEYDSDESEDNLQNDRKTIITQMLRQYGLVLRDDSRLCWNYIRYDEGDPREIVNVMRDMDWYFRFTEYPKYIAETRDSPSSKRRALRHWCQQHVSSDPGKMNWPPTKETRKEAKSIWNSFQK